MRKSVVAALAAFSAAFGTASAAVVDFDALSANEVLAGQIPGMSFSSDVGQVAVYYDPSFAHSGDNSIGAWHNDGHFMFTADVHISWDSPVNDLSFWSIGGNDVGQQATIDIFGLGDSLLASIALVGAGDPGAPDFQDLSAFAEVTRIAIRSVTDTGGLVYDTFAFTPVPVPAGAVLLVTGLGGLAAMRRRRKVAA